MGNTEDTKDRATIVRTGQVKYKIQLSDGGKDFRREVDNFFECSPDLIWGHAGLVAMFCTMNSQSTMADT